MYANFNVVCDMIIIKKLLSTTHYCSRVRTLNMMIAICLLTAVLDLRFHRYTHMCVCVLMSRVYNNNTNIQDLDELESVLASVIASSLIRGYVNHEHRKLVLAIDNPFPRNFILVTKIAAERDEYMAKLLEDKAITAAAQDEQRMEDT
jgi:hypothetical protein